MKRCSVCRETKPLDEFHNRQASPDGKAYQCKPCARARTVAQYEKGEGSYARAYRRAQRFGMTPEQYDALLTEQGGVCAICKTDDPGGSRSWNVDHDHACCPGRYSCGNCVRGLLCIRCNAGIGYLADSPERLIAAAAYVRERSVQ